MSFIISGKLLPPICNYVLILVGCFFFTSFEKHRIRYLFLISYSFNSLRREVHTPFLYIKHVSYSANIRVFGTVPLKFLFLVAFCGLEYLDPAMPLINSKTKYSACTFVPKNLLHLLPSII